MSISGRPVPILTVGSDEKFIFHEDAASSVLMHESVRDKPICFVPVAGAFRKGKSFLLNFMLRFLNENGSEDWIEKTATEELTGFHWCGGSQRDTTGILIWSKVFMVTSSSGKEIGVVLMDTQGAFDRKTSLKTTVTVFALSLMTSSTFIFNLDENIQEDDLQHLQFFANFGKLALDESEDTPFQKLVFLIRDWQFPYEKPFGREGGKQLLTDSLKVEEEQPEELQTLRKDLLNCFESMECFLLPYPGRAVTNPAFKGLGSEMDPEFLDHLNDFMKTVLAPDALTVKKVGGREVRCKDMIHFIKSFFEVLNAEEMPEPRTMLNVTIEANNVVCMIAARELFEEKMEELVGGDKPYVNAQAIEEHYLHSTELALEEFGKVKKMGGEEHSKRYREQLLAEIDETYRQYKAHNDSKNIMNIAGTPITLAFVWISLYLFSQVAAILLLGPLVSLIYYIQLATVITASAWGYSKYSGNYTTVSLAIDRITSRIWEALVRPLVGQALQNYLGTKRHHKREE